MKPLLKGIFPLGHIRTSCAADVPTSTSFGLLQALGEAGEARLLWQVWCDMSLLGCPTSGWKQESFMLKPALNYNRDLPGLMLSAASSSFGAQFPCVVQ